MSIVSIIVLGFLYFCVFLVIVISVSGYLKRIQKPLIFFSATLIILILTYNSILVFANYTDGGKVTAIGPSQTTSLLVSPTLIPGNSPTPTSFPALIPENHPTANPSPNPSLIPTPSVTPRLHSEPDSDCDPTPTVTPTPTPTPSPTPTTVTPSRSEPDSLTP